MSQTAWSTLLQWSRLGVNAALFLIAARHLTLPEIGAFATAFAPIRLLQVVHKSGLADAYIVSDKVKPTRNAFFALSLFLGLIFTLFLLLTAQMLPASIAVLMVALSPIPLLCGLSAIPEATLRAALRLKALALRTLFAQILSAVLALLALKAGWGAFALVVFALTNAFAILAISIALAPIRPSALPTRKALRAALPDILRISARDLVGNATQPLLQLAVSAFLGLPAAGAFQIAARTLGLLDALAISPIRYIALPRFAALSGHPAFACAVLQSLCRTSLIASLIYLGALATAPDLLTLAVGSAHAASTAPLLPAFCLLGLVNALAMPLNQSLTAIGLARLPLRRSLATLALTALLAVPALTQSTLATAGILPLAAGLVLIPYAGFAAKLLGLEPLSTLTTIAPPLLAGILMAIGLNLVDPSLQDLTPLLRLTIKVALGTGFYAALLFALRLPDRMVTP